jgi:hypothetical protein
MKISLARGSREGLSRQTAWGCFTTNLTLPGFGSLMGGRLSGYAQAFLGIAGLVLTTLFGVRFVIWYFTNSSRLQNPDADPFANFAELWHVLRWPVLGIAVFAAGWLWALATSLGLLRQAKTETQACQSRVPPRLAGPPPANPGSSG